MPVSRLGYQFCEVKCDWLSDKGHSGHLTIPEQKDHGIISIQISQEPNINNPLEVMEIQLANPQSKLTNPVIGTDKCFVKIVNDISKSRLVQLGKYKKRPSEIVTFFILMFPVKL